jgi:hypothetical protein
MYISSMSATFEAEKNRKAFIYTAAICGALLLLALLISWTHEHAPSNLVVDMIEINLGNNAEGYGEVQPLIKGDKSPGEESAEPRQTSVVKTAAPEETKTDDLADKESAPVTKPVKTTVKVKETTPEVKPEPKPQKPKIAGYSGPKGTGNGATEDNGYKYQGNNPNGKGDAGSPNGKPDSYGNTPGGKSGGVSVYRGDRQIVNNYIFVGVLPKANVYAVVKVTPAGKGTFVTFDKKSTTTEARYATEIRNYLVSMEFSKADHESTITVLFKFTQN